VKFARREEAERAVNALHGRQRDKEAPGLLQVRFAHTKAEKAMLIGGGAAAGGVPGLMGFPAAMQSQLWGSMPSLLGAGASPAAAAAAAHFYQGAAAGGAAGAQGAAAAQQQWSHPLLAAGAGGAMGLPYAAAASPAALQLQYNPAAAAAYGGVGLAPKNDVRGPSGANLFIYNLPLTFTDQDLGALFATFGTVLSSHIQRDKATGASKGFGNPQLPFHAPLSPRSLSKSLLLCVQDL
jgi:hypothetical protein